MTDSIYLDNKLFVLLFYMSYAASNDMILRTLKTKHDYIPKYTDRT